MSMSATYVPPTVSMRSSSVRGTGVPKSGMPGTLRGEGCQVLDGSGDGGGWALLVDGRTDQLELERSVVAGLHQQAEHSGEGKVAVAGHDAADHGPVEQEVGDVAGAQQGGARRVPRRRGAKVQSGRGVDDVDRESGGTDGPFRRRRVARRQLGHRDPEVVQPDMVTESDVFLRGRSRGGQRAQGKGEPRGRHRRWATNHSRAASLVSLKYVV